MSRRTCPSCHQLRDHDDPTEALCVSCGVCAVCRPTAGGAGAREVCAVCQFVAVSEALQRAWRQAGLYGCGCVSLHPDDAVSGCEVHDLARSMLAPENESCPWCKPE